MNQIRINIKTMSSTELGELLGYEKKEVNRKVLSMFQSEIDGVIITPSLDARGYVTEYHLPEIEAQMFAAKWNIQHLRKVVEFFIDNQAPTIPQTYATALLEAGRLAQIVDEQASQLVIAAPKVEYHDKVLDSRNGISTTEIAAEFNMSAIALNRILGDMSVQRKIGKRWVLTVGMMGQGYEQERTFVSEDGNSRHSMLWTEKGRQLIHELMESKL